MRVNNKRLNGRVSAVWLAPVAALAIGLWLIVEQAIDRGPTVQLTFESADGIQAGLTRVKRLSVDLGLVQDVYLNPGYNDVTVVVELDKGTADLLREDTRFWVVRPRVGSSGVSGLSTLLSGAYIELAPGNGSRGRRSFVGLEEPPITPPSTPGLHINLIALSADSVNVGSPVVYNGFSVGRVEQKTLELETGQTRLRAFVEAPYHDLMTTSTRFWNASGIHAQASAQGFSVQTASLETILTGGIAFGLPSHAQPGNKLAGEAEFLLYDSPDAVDERPYRYGREYLLLFDASVRGLQSGAPVEYRGVRLGTVSEVGLDLVAQDEIWTAQGHALMPVLIRLDPGRLSEDTADALSDIETLVETGASNGLRATLATGNLLTGSLFVSLDFYDDVPAKSLEQRNGYTILPTTVTGIAQLQQQFAALMNKIEGLPLEQTVVTTTNTLGLIGNTAKSASVTLDELSTWLDQPETHELPVELVATLTQLREVLAGLDPDSPLYQQLELTVQELKNTAQHAGNLVEQLEQQPNALLLPSRHSPDPVPRTKQ